MTKSTVMTSSLMTAHILIYIGAILGPFATLPQIIRIIKTKDAKAISYWFLMIRILAFILFMIAIILTGHAVMAASYIIILVANIAVLLLKVKYG